jgi:hypothetical protein
MRNAWQADMAYRPTIDLNALDAKLRKLCENKADYLAKRRTIWSAVPVLSHDTTEIARLYQAHISAIKQINKRRGHDRARQIARERDLLRERDWFDAMFGL